MFLILYLDKYLFLLDNAFKIYLYYIFELFLFFFLEKVLDLAFLLIKSIA